MRRTLEVEEAAGIGMLVIGVPIGFVGFATGILFPFMIAGIVIGALVGIGIRQFVLHGTSQIRAAEANAQRPGDDQAL